MPNQYDITIIGGGMVGLALAAKLSKLPYKIALIDATNPKNQTTDQRLIALTYNSCEFFNKLNIWNKLRDKAAPIKTIHVSHKGHFGIARLHASDINQQTLGHVVPAKYINTALNDEVQNKNITILQPATLKNIKQEKQDVTLALNQESQKKIIKSKIVIAADGTNSTVRSLLNTPFESSPSTQKALVTITHLKRSHNSIAYERFHATGALAMLPLTDNRVATIWTDHADNIEHLLNLSDKEFITALQKQMGYRLGKFLQCTQRFSYPLKWIYVKPEHQKNNNILLIGNAAHTIHPIAAQGFNLAIKEIDFLTKYFSTQNTETILAPENFDYAHHQENSINISKQLSHIFKINHAPIKLLRQLSLLTLDFSSLAKKRFLKSIIC